MAISYLDIPLLVSWLSARQYAPEGGFSGRTNKLVDGCYSHWVGGCWPLLEAAISSTHAKQGAENVPEISLYSRDSLIRYILACCQSEKGGLRDKPSTLVYLETHQKLDVNVTHYSQIPRLIPLLLRPSRTERSTASQLL